MMKTMSRMLRANAFLLTAYMANQWNNIPLDRFIFVLLALVYSAAAGWSDRESL